VDNATEQDWENVKLSLVSGRPISFSMDLYQPQYIARPEEQVALYGSIRPPEYLASLDAPAPRQADRGLGGGRFLSKRSPGQGGGGGGEASDEESANNLIARVSDADLAMVENMLRPARTGVSSIASAKSAGELFEYEIKSPVTLKRQQSAMLPIVTEEIDGQKFSVFNPTTHPKHPLNAIRLKNTSKLFLMQGPVTVFDGGVYAGDAKLPDLRAGEERLLGYALDLATEVEIRNAGKPDEVTQIRIAKGTMILQHKFVDERTYIVRNKGDAAKTVILEQDAGDDWKLVGPKEPYERAAGLMRFKLDLPAGQTQSLTVRLEKLWDEQVILTSLGGEQIDIYLRMKVSSDSVKKALAEVVKLRAVLDDTRRQIALVNQEINSISTEQSRIRENMKVLSQTSDVYRRYEKKFGEQETRVERLNGDLANLQQQEQKQLQDLEKFLMSLEVK
jgi:hypothetical protein